MDVSVHPVISIIIKLKKKIEKKKINLNPLMLTNSYRSFRLDLQYFGQ